MLKESRNDCAFFSVTRTKQKETNKKKTHKKENSTRKMDPAKQLVTVWNVTVREVVSQLVSKCSESGSVESAIENRFNRQCQTNVTRLPFFLFFFFFFKLDGWEGRNRPDRVILFTEIKKKPFTCLLLKFPFAIYLLKDTLPKVIN